MRKLTKQKFKELAGKKLGEQYYCIPFLDADGDIVIADEIAIKLNVKLPHKKEKHIIIKKDKSDKLPKK